MKKGIVVLVAVLLSLLGTFAIVAGCSSTTPQQAKEQLNTNLENLKTALNAFTNPATYVSTDSIKSAADNVQKQFNAVVSSAKNVKSVSTSTLSDAWNQLSKSISNLSSSQSFSDKVSGVKTAIENFQSAWQQVFSSAQSQ